MPLYSSFEELNYEIDIATVTESIVSTSLGGDEFHGVWHDTLNNNFLLTTYGGDVYVSDASGLTGSILFSSDNTTMDITQLVTLRSENDTLEFCPSTPDSMMVSLIYDVPGFQWYKDGVLYSETNDTIYVSDPGTYRALYPIDGGMAYMWSEPITVIHTAHVDITSPGGDTQLCPGETITLTGESTGTLQWFLYGSPISGETGSTLTVSAPGIYNQSQTNMGCTDTADASFVITNATVPVVTITESSSDTMLCPGETITLNGASGGTLQWYLDGSAIAGATTNTYNATAPGTYNQMKTNLSGCSDTAAVPYVIYDDSPVVSISQAMNDSLICPGDTITLTGITEDAMQWYMNGTMISGATSNTYNATSAGIYNQFVTKIDGCSDSAAVGFTIYDDTNCNAGIDINDMSVRIYPNPVGNNLFIESDIVIHAIVIFDLNGREVYHKENIDELKIPIDFQRFEKGSYLLQLSTDNGQIRRTIIK